MPRDIVQPDWLTPAKQMRPLVEEALKSERLFPGEWGFKMVNDRYPALFHRLSWFCLWAKFGWTTIQTTFYCEITAQGSFTGNLYGEDAYMHRKMFENADLKEFKEKIESYLGVELEETWIKGTVHKPWTSSKLMGPPTALYKEDPVTGRLYY